MRKINLSVLLITISIWANAQFTISGKITDSDGTTLVGASVQLKGTYLGVSSNSLGEYNLSNVKGGEYTLVVNYIGYETNEKNINITEDMNVDIVLKSKTLMSDEVIVVASRAKEKNPFAQTTLHKEDIAKQNIIADIPYQLELTPSVVASSESGAGVGNSSMRIRGTSIYRINVTVNGVPLNDPESQGVYWVNMPDFTSSVNSIQIQRGVGTSSNGSAAFGASVNFQTMTLEPKPYANISSSIGSFNTFKENVSAGTGLINNKFAFDVRASKLNSDGYIQRGFSDHKSLYFSGTYYGEKDMLKAVAIFGEQKTGITWWGVPDYMVDSIRNFNPAGQYFDDDGNEQFYDGQTDNYKQNHYQLLYSREINKNLNVNATLHATTGKGFYEQYKEDDDFSDYGLNNIQLSDTIIKNGQYTYIFPDSTISSSDIIRQKWLDNIFYGATANINYHKNKVDATFGIAANNYDGDHFGHIKWAKFNTSIPNNYEWYNNKGTKRDLSSFLKFQYAITKQLSAFADVQVRNINYTMSGADDDLMPLDQTNNWTFFNPKAGVNYQLNQQQRMYASFAIANREPARADLKEALKNGGKKVPTYETLNDVELGYEIKQTKYVLGINAYYMIYKNQLVNTGELNSVGYPIMTNVDNSFRRGIELMGGVHILSNLSWNANFTYSQNRINDYVEYSTHYDASWNETIEAKELGQTHISYSPEFIGSSIIRYEPIKGLGASLTTKYVGHQYFDNTSSSMRDLDAYLLNHIGLDYSYKFKNGPRVNLQFLVNNIFNVDYISNAYGGNWYENDVEKTWAYYYPQAGRNYMCKVALMF
jgi:iron complex outermembrane receptor protein